MKKLLVSSLMLLAMSASFAQNAKTKTVSGTTFGITAGVDFRNMYGKLANGDKITDNDLAVKYHAGVNVGFPIGKDLEFQPGIIVATKGSKSEGTYLGVAYEQTRNFFYLDIPMNFIYRPVLGAGNLLLGGGPYVGFGIGGKVKSTSGSNTITTDVEYRNDLNSTDPVDKAYLKRMDGGVNVLAGYELSNGISFQLNTSLGLLNVMPQRDGQANNDATEKHIGFGVSVGYRFGR